MDILRELIDAFQDELGAELVSDIKAREIEARLRAQYGGLTDNYINTGYAEQIAQRNEAIAGAVRQGVQPVELAQRFGLGRVQAWRYWKKYSKTQQI